MSTYSSSSDNTTDRMIHSARTRVETSDQVRRRVDLALAQTRSWHASGQVLSATTSCPMSPEQAMEFLDREISAFNQRERDQHAVKSAAEKRMHDLVAHCGDLNRQLDVERRRCEDADRLAQQRTAAERLAADEVRRSTEEQALIATAELQSANALLVAADRRSEIGRAINPRVDKKCKKCSTPAQAAALKAKHDTGLAMIICVGDRPIPWLDERVIFGQRMAPIGLAEDIVHMPAPYCRMVGGMGRLALRVDWSSYEALEEAASILDAQLIPCLRRGGLVDHVGHGVLSKSLDGKEVAQKWTPETAMRATLVFLICQGVDPARHDFVVFIHSQSPAQQPGTLKMEESVHILWCRRRDDGAYHVNPHECVSALIGRTRYDNHAGINPGRIGISLSKKEQVQIGMAKAKQGTLAAWYVDPVTGKKLDHTRILGDVVAQRLAAVGRPDQGDHAGVWVMKPRYRTADEIREILMHLIQGD